MLEKRKKIVELKMNLHQQKKFSSKIVKAGSLVSQDVFMAQRKKFEKESEELLAKEGKQFLCDEKCNDCPLINHPNKRQMDKMLNEIYNKFGTEAYEIIEKNCPNFTCCYDCRIDDFCHDEDCQLNNKEENYYCSECGNKIENEDCAYNVCNSCRIEL